jgi:hypothetical protein
MRTLQRFGLLITLCSLALLALPASAQEDTESNPLLDLLGYVPDTQTYRDFLSYGDPALWIESWGIDGFESVQDIERRRNEDSIAWPATAWVMPRQTSAPNAIGLDYLITDQMRPYWGIDFLNLDRFIEAGNPPEVLTLMETSASNDAIAAALTNSEYTESALGDATLYSRNDDYAIDMAGDGPMLSRLGALNRVALLDDVVIVGRATAIAESAVDAVTGDVTSLAENAVFRAGALAVSDPTYAGEGDLVGALFMGQAQPLDVREILGSRATPEQVNALLERFDFGTPLPLYHLAVFGTRSRENDSQLLLALVFPPGVDAQAATDIVLMRMKQYESLRTRQPLTELFAERGVEVEWGRGVDIEGVPVALISLSAANPTFEETGSGMRNTAMFSWMDMVYARDIGFIAVTGQ